MKISRVACVAFCVAGLFGSCTLFSSTVFLLNKTGGSIWVTSQYVPWGMVFPAKIKSRWLQNDEAMAIKAYRFGWMGILDERPEEKDDARRFSKIVSISGDRRIKDACQSFVEDKGYSKDRYCNPDHLKVLDAKLEKGRLILGQPAIENIIIPLRLAVTKKPDTSDFIITEIGVGRGTLFSRGRFFNHLKEVRIPQVEIKMTPRPREH